jgi:hypothetical protein
MTTTMSMLQWRKALAQLCQDAGYDSPELAQLIEAYEELAADYAALLAEHERLKQETAARKVRADSEAVAGYMSSKLWDAIHE